MKKHDAIILTPENSLEKNFIALCKQIKAKRAKIVIDHILRHGFITTEDLKDIYKYDHPPRAIRDVRESGVPLITHQLQSGKTGRTIAAYTFGDPRNIQRGRIGGRKIFPKKFKEELLDMYGSRDAFTQEKLEPRYLQIDHRIPYQIRGDGDELDVHDFMLIDASSQRAKSWSCESCDNFKSKQLVELCQTCFWASPEKYTHIALEEKRRLEITWSGSEADEFDAISRRCESQGMEIREYIKALLRK